MLLRGLTLCLEDAVDSLDEVSCLADCRVGCDVLVGDGVHLLAALVGWFLVVKRDADLGLDLLRLLQLWLSLWRLLLLLIGSVF